MMLRVAKWMRNSKLGNTNPHDLSYAEVTSNQVNPCDGFRMKTKCTQSFEMHDNPYPYFTCVHWLTGWLTVPQRLHYFVAIKSNLFINPQLLAFQTNSEKFMSFRKGQEKRWKMEQKWSQWTGFEPVREDPIGFRVQLLNHSDTTACWKWGWELRRFVLEPAPGWPTYRRVHECLIVSVIFA